MAFLVTESLSDLVIVYLITKRLTMPFAEWDAYKQGIINKDGKKLKEPASSSEKAAWTMLDVMVWNMKKLLGKYINDSALARYFTAAMLLKDHYSPYIYNKLLNEQKKPALLEEFNCSIQNELFTICRGIAVERLNAIDSDLLFNVHKYEHRVAEHLDVLKGIFGDNYED